MKAHSQQKANPLLKHLGGPSSLSVNDYACLQLPHPLSSNFDDDLVVDFQPNETTGVVFICLRFHIEHPQYLAQRISLSKGRYNNRVVLCVLDKDEEQPLLEINMIAHNHNCQLMCCTSNEEAAKYLRALQSHVQSSAEVLQERAEDSDVKGKATEVLTQIRRVNKSDVITLFQTFGSFSAIVEAPESELSSCPGLGPKKVERLSKIFDQPFV